ncbi:aromatic-ring hydroxylase C-terminal domain-containing protein [Sphingosinicella rhizophila]|uniref:aromatic-ring hydroxylase C-terminal domain-containing protein n=1 Tax=Sphingosinicella rhizophila TaxID=3050082 RepID=UPI0039657681
MRDKWGDRLKLVNAIHEGFWELPAFGTVAAPPALLIRPDGHIAWVGEIEDPKLELALTKWIGRRINF